MGTDLKQRMSADQKVVVDYNDYWKTFSIRLWWNGHAMGGTC